MRICFAKNLFTKMLSIILLILLLVPCSFGAVSETGSGTAFVVDTTSPATLTTFTVDSGSDVLIAGLSSAQALVSSVAISWDSGGTPQAMTSLGSAANGNSRVEIFYFLNPTAGNLSLEATWTTNTDVVLWAVAFTGGTTPNNFDSLTGSSTTPNVTITGSSTGATVGGESNGSAYLTGTGADEVEIFRNTTGTIGAGASYKLASDSQNHDWTMSTGAWVAAGLHVPASAASTCPKTLSTLGVGC